MGPHPSRPGATVRSIGGDLAEKASKRDPFHLTTAILADDGSVAATDLLVDAVGHRTASGARSEKRCYYFDYQTVFNNHCFFNVLLLSSFCLHL